MRVVLPRGIQPAAPGSAGKTRGEGNGSAFSGRGSESHSQHRLLWLKLRNGLKTCLSPEFASLREDKKRRVRMGLDAVDAVTGFVEHQRVHYGGPLFTLMNFS